MFQLMILLYKRSRRDYTTNTNRMPPICLVLLPFILSLLICYLISLSSIQTLDDNALISGRYLTQTEILSQYN